MAKFRSKTLAKLLPYHKWLCQCGTTLSTDVSECPICKERRQKETSKKRSSKKGGRNNKLMLYMRLGKHPFTKPHTLTAIGKKYHITRQRVSQIIQRQLAAHKDQIK